MTRDSTRSLDGGHDHRDAEVDLLAGLWEEAPFARLPWDAPTELKELIEDIENPKRVYAVHRASRRHNFQLLLEKFIVQLRDGCGSSTCTTATCFSCRKRIAGRAPIRRYNTTSARVLAVYMASQDNPENGLCPTLRSPKPRPAALDSLIFSPKCVPPQLEDRSAQLFKGQNGHARSGSLKGRQTTIKMRQSTGLKADEQDASQQEKGENAGQVPLNESRDDARLPRFDIVEKSAGKDYRSFAANMFGTVAFKMLEWLTPNSIEDMSAKARELQGDLKPQAPKDKPVKERSESSPGSARPTPTDSDLDEQLHKEIRDRGNGSTETSREVNGGARTGHEGTQGTEEGILNGHRVPSAPRPGSQRRNSNARVRTSSTNKHKRLSADIPQDATPDDALSAFKSPRKAPKPPKSTGPTLTRPISQLSSAGYFDAVSLEKMPPPKHIEAKPKLGRGQIDGAQSGDGDSLRQMRSNTSLQSSEDQNEDDTPEGLDSDLESSYDSLLPQALSRLNADVVDFVCDVLQEDQTCETHLFEPKTVSKLHSGTSNQHKSMRRKSKAKLVSSLDLRSEWRLFVEQSLFYVLSDPHTLIRSFTKKGQLYDSQTLWYCMLRMTRVAPTLVFHSLWLAAASLFAPPKTVQSLRSPTARLFPKQEKVLSNAEAGVVMSICLHALVAAAPKVVDVRQLYDMSRIRSHGLSLSGSGAVARQPTELCLQYDDAFSNDLTMRLARRLFAAVTTRRYYDGMIEHELDSDVDASEQADVLAPLFSQLDFLNMDAVYILNFSFFERTLHEARVPTLLLDWARAVMLNDWDGSPEVPGDGPFGGALALIEAMYNKRQALLLGDAQFRAEYFAERLDEVVMPIAWLSFTSTKQKFHLLDFPYIFNPSTLVSYFRSINFSRMSRSFEESSSLKNRMEHIIQPGSLIINNHHKNVLQDLLHTASSKYLILDISRDNVITDAFDQLWRREERELMRPLKVHLGEEGGEEGFDSGGVQQEFFRMAIAEALDPKYGAFTIDDRTRMVWFQPGSLEAEWKFELVGLLISLAVYNGLTLPITFPKALYRKLLGEPVTELHHIADGWPDLASGLTTLLEWDEKDGLVEDVFARTYEFSVSMFDEHISREMNSDNPEWPQFPKSVAESSSSTSPLSAANPPDAPLVTGENRNAYVSDYIHYLTDVSVKPQYEAFARGFRTCLHPKSLTLLTSNLLQSIVEGVQDIDIADLRRYTRYVGWDSTHRTIKDFWSIVKRYDDRMKRKLLEFVTASDRVPVGGMKNLQFVVQRNGEEGDGGHLPTAYTCYGTLLLPEYHDKEILRERLSMALENAQGFGFA